MMDDYRSIYDNSLTKQSSEAWAHLKPNLQIERLRDMSLMFEARLSELDPLYMSHPFGKVTIKADTVELQNSAVPRLCAAAIRAG
jgi:hypothetical protein